MRLAAEHEVLVFFGDASERVIRVDEAPVVEGRAVVVIGPGICGGRGGEVEPLAFAAVEILFLL